MANKKRTAPSKGKGSSALTVKQKNKILIGLCAAVLVFAIVGIAFLLKIPYIGRDVKIVYSTKGGTSVAGDYQIVEVWGKYTLKTPKDTTGDDREFLYWSDKDGNKVDFSGRWLESIDNVILYAVWGEGEWSNNY